MRFCSAALSGFVCAVFGCVILSCAVLGCATSAFSAEAVGGVQPENMVCEHLVNPLGVDAVHPRLGWTLKATSDQRGQKQTAYQILVAGSEKQLAADQGDLWDSGKVASDRCAEIVYAGKALKSYQLCFWKVRVWDQDGKASAWTAPASWSMGILDPQDWKAKWLSYVKLPPADSANAIKSLSIHGTQKIWLPDQNAAQNVSAGTCYFRKTFTLPDDAKLRWGGVIITVDDQFTLYVNGKKIGKSSGEEYAWRHPQRYDLTGVLTPGKNVIAVEAVNTAESPAGLFAAWKVEFENGDCTFGISDSSWRVSKTADVDWEMASFDDSKWPTARIYGMINLTPEDKTTMEVDRSDWPQKAPSPIFRKTFNVQKPLARATAMICGLGCYELRLNGGKVGDHVLDPVYTRFDRRDLYATYDVTSQLTQGKNAVGVMLGNGFFNPFARDAWYFEKTPWRNDPMMLVQLRLDYADGTSEVVASDATWRASTGPVTHDGARHGEDYDARLEPAGWDTAAFDDSSWAEPKIVAGPKGVLSAEMMPPNRVMQTITPVSVTEPKPGVFVFDMGQNFSGWAQLKVSGPAGAKVTMHYSERILDDGTVDQRISAPYVFEGPFQTNTYTLKGQGEEVWEPRFAFHGYRYVEVTGFPGKPTADNVRGRVVHTAFAPTGSFECSNELLNKIQQCTLWSYRSNFVGIPTDCPHREKNGWTGDAHLACEQAMFNFNNVAAYEMWIQTLRDQQRPNGMFPGIVPTSGWGFDWGNGPAWDSAFILIPWYCYQYYGDVGLLEANYDQMKRYVDYLTGRAKDHIVDIGLGDWVPAKTETPVPVTSTGYYYVDATIVAKTAQLLGKTEDAKKYADLAEEIRKAFNEKFCHKDGTVANNSQTSLSCAIHQGLAAPDQVPAIIDQLVKNVEGNNNHLDTGILGMKYLFRTLTNHGRTDVAYRIATQTTAPSYGAWIQRGATTLWEDWQDGYSRNHIMFGDISAWFYQALAGINIDPEQPAFKHFFIRPQPVGDLKWVRATHESIYGPIAVAWEKKEGTFSLDITVPVNTSATVSIPAKNVESITENGKAATQTPGVQFLRMDEGTAVFEVSAGKYTFVVKNPG
jgi:alpha-L-rhamnosidase